MKSEIAMAKIAEAELKTVCEYTKLVEEVDCPQCKRVIEDIIREEIVHVGEAMANLKRFRPDWKLALEEGEAEGTEIAKSRPLNQPFFKDSIVGERPGSSIPNTASSKDYTDNGIITTTFNTSE